MYTGTVAKLSLGSLGIPEAVGLQSIFRGTSLVPYMVLDAVLVYDLIGSHFIHAYFHTYMYTQVLWLSFLWAL